MTNNDKALLELIENNAKISHEQIAVLLDLTPQEVEQRIAQLEQNGTIIKYQTLINWEKTGEEKVNAVIEVKITPQREVGFDAVAERIYRFPEVTSVRLMSGKYDLLVFMEGQTMKEVAQFVTTRLATIEHVLSTATHFVLKTYKQHGCILEDKETNRRLVVSP